MDRDYLKEIEDAAKKRLVSVALTCSWVIVGAYLLSTTADVLPSAVSAFLPRMVAADPFVDGHEMLGDEDI